MQELGVCGCPHLSDAAFQYIARRMGCLQVLNVSHCRRITDEAVQLLSERLWLEVSYSRLLVTSLECCFLLWVVDTLAAFNVQEVDLSHCKHITDDAVISLVRCSCLALICCHCQRPQSSLPCVAVHQWSRVFFDVGCGCRLMDVKASKCVGCRGAQTSQLEL